ncbi:MAG: hypothetical protein U0X58_05435 [Flavobacteriaceae bacterium]
MNMNFYQQITTGNAGLKCRNANLKRVLDTPDLLNDLVEIAVELSDKNQHKAIWIVEMIAEQNAALLQPFAQQLLETIPYFKHESAIRGSSRIVLFMSKFEPSFLSEAQQQTCIEIALDWLINNQIKVAPKANAMYTLAHYMKREVWLKDELREIIGKDFAKQSAAYKAAAKLVLKKLKA